MNVLEVFSDSTLQKAEAILKEAQYAPGDIIFERGDEGNTIYLVLKGELQSEIDNKVTKIFKKNESFGQIR